MAALKILSVDGGGIRGVIPAFWLAEFERKHGIKVSDKFDIFAGTSTGAIIASALALGWDAQKIAEKYREIGPKIFKRGLFSKPSSRYGRSPKYSAAGLDSSLKQFFLDLGEDVKMSKVVERGKRLLVVSFDASSRDRRIFDSEDAGDANEMLWEICRASAAAPTYFPAHISKINKPMLDGGLAANNPSAVALSAGLRSRQGLAPEDILLLSLGTGQRKDSINAQNAKRWGWQQWATCIVDLVFDGSSGINDEVTKNILPEKNYFRIQLDDLPKNLVRLDGVNNLAELIQKADDSWRSSDTVTKAGRIADLLKKETTRVSGEWYSHDAWTNDSIPPDPWGESMTLSDSSNNTKVVIEDDEVLVAGHSVATKEKPDFRFQGRWSGMDLIGEWKSNSKNLRGVFMLRYLPAKESFEGYWIGTGDQGLFTGPWILTRTKDRKSSR
jgi:predicted acylesterase/phospholipase RssA